MINNRFFSNFIFAILISFMVSTNVSGQIGYKVFIKLIDKMPIQDSSLTGYLPLNIIISNDSLKDEDHIYHDGLVNLYFRQVAFFIGIDDVFLIDTFWFNSEVVNLILLSMKFDHSNALHKKEPLIKRLKIQYYINVENYIIEKF